MKKIMLLILTACMLITASCVVKRPDTGHGQVANLLLQGLADRDWQYAAAQELLGDVDSFFEDYAVYFERGVRVRLSEIPEMDENGWKGCKFSRTGRMENIVFDAKYTDEFLPGVSLGADGTDVQKAMGKPDFVDAALQVFGYKTEDFYIFFQGDSQITQVSVYPGCPNYDAEAIRQVINLCQGKELSPVLAVMAAGMLEREWPDYNYSYAVLGNAQYSRRSNSVGLAYYAKGVALTYDAENADTALLHIYGNYDGSLSDAEYAAADANGQQLIARYPDTDFVFAQEKARINAQIALAERIENDGAVSPDGTSVLVDNSHSNGIDVIDLTGNHPDYCIVTSPMQYGAAQWLDNRYIVYAYGKGEIRVYDLADNRYQKIISGFAQIQTVQDGCITLAPVSGSEIVIYYTVTDQGDIRFANADGTSWEDAGAWIDGEIADTDDCWM